MLLNDSKFQYRGKMLGPILESEICSPPKKVKSKYRSNFFQAHE